MVLRLNDLDNVAVALEACKEGEQTTVKTKTGDFYEIYILTDIPFCHKCALQDIKSGELIIKYGHPIGIATTDISKGEVVGVHNIEGLRGRGDLKA